MRVHKKTDEILIRSFISTTLKIFLNKQIQTQSEGHYNNDPSHNRCWYVSHQYWPDITANEETDTEGYYHGPVYFSGERIDDKGHEISEKRRKVLDGIVNGESEVVRRHENGQHDDPR